MKAGMDFHRKHAVDAAVQKTVDNRDNVAVRIGPGNVTAVLLEKAVAFSEIRKIGRTHLQDAVPVTLGQEFSGYARQVELGVERLDGVGPRLSELALGGTAVGTGLNTHPEFASGVIAGIAVDTGISFREAVNHFEAQAAQDAVVRAPGGR